MEGFIKRQRESIIKQDWILQQLSMDQEMWRRGGYSHIYTSGPTRSIPFTWWEKLPVIIIMHLDVCTYLKFVSKLVLFCGICWSKSHLWSIMVARDLMKVSIICLMFLRAKTRLKCNKQFWSQSYNFDHDDIIPKFFYLWSCSCQKVPEMPQSFDQVATHIKRIFLGAIRVSGNNYRD